MSGLYDALKEARRFRQGPNGFAGERVWDALGIDGTDVLPDLTDPPAGEESPPAPELEQLAAEQTASAAKLEATTPAAVLPEELGVVIPPAESVPGEALHSVCTAPAGSFGTYIKVTMDPNARLIPHAVDRVVVEYYRKLRTKILQQQAEKAFRSLVVTSASPLEGKTVTVLNLGLSFAMLPAFKVLVVDGDLRKGTLGHWLGIDDDQPGLSNLIDGSAQLEEVALRSDEIPLHFIVRGNSLVPDLHSSLLNHHFQKMTEHFDLVLVDTPPVNVITDVQLFAANCDAVLLIARAFSTTRKAFEKAVQDLLPFRVIGTVLNGGTAQRYRYHGYY